MENRKHEMIFKTRMNVNYHEGLEKFYSSFINWTGILSVAFSGATFASVIDIIFKNQNITGNSILVFLSCLAFLLNGAVLAFGMLQKLYLHTDLKKRWINVLLHLNLSDGSKENLDETENEISQIEKDEPAPNRRRLKTAHKEICVALGLTESKA